MYAKLGACVYVAWLAQTRYMYIAITLARLEDFDNACSSYEKAIEM
eukprot:SAG11_NODE_10178_length_849_cov_1.280000_2_plen_46_part_00